MSLALSNKTIMKNLQIVFAVAFSSETEIKTTTDFSLPGWIVNPGTLANIFGQFQPFIDG